MAASSSLRNEVFVVVLRCLAIIFMALSAVVVAASTTSVVPIEKDLTVYIKQIYAGSSSVNQAVVIDTGRPGDFGSITVNDWVVFPDLGESYSIGYAQGLHLKANTESGSWFVIFTIVFDNDLIPPLKGSTLQLMGYISSDGQWSIIGGTGGLARASGVATHKIVSDGIGYRMYEVHMVFFYTPLPAVLLEDHRHLNTSRLMSNPKRTMDLLDA